jgi:hypothetical protein
MYILEFWGLDCACHPITKIVPNYTYFLHKFSGNFSRPLAVFPVDNSSSSVIFELENQLQRAPPVRGCLFRPGRLSEVAGHVVRHAPTGLLVPRAFKGADIPTKSVRHHHLSPHGKRRRSSPCRPPPQLTSSPSICLAQVIVTALNPHRRSSHHHL